MLNILCYNTFMRNKKKPSTNIIGVRVTELERIVLERKAKDKEMLLSEYVRFKLGLK